MEDATGQSVGSFGAPVWRDVACRLPGAAALPLSQQLPPFFKVNNVQYAVFQEIGRGGSSTVVKVCFCPQHFDPCSASGSPKSPINPMEGTMKQSGLIARWL